MERARGQVSRRRGMTMPDCSIVIVTYNGWDLVQRCLGALDTELRPGVDVIVVDNGSADGLPNRTRSEFKWANVVETGRNLGFAGGNNVGIQLSTSEFVLLLNSDAIVRPGFLDHMLSPFDDHPRVGSVAATMVFHSRPDLVASAGVEVYRNGLALDRAVGEPAVSLSDGTSIFGASAGAAMYRRQALDEVGPFPESFFMYLEDVDLAWRLRLRGWESILRPVPLPSMSIRPRRWKDRRSNGSCSPETGSGVSLVAIRAGCWRRTGGESRHTTLWSCPVPRLAETAPVSPDGLRPWQDSGPGWRSARKFKREPR